MSKGKIKLFESEQKEVKLTEATYVDYVKEMDVILASVNKHKEELVSALYDLKEYANDGANIMGGSMQNKYGVTEEIPKLYNLMSYLKNQADSARYELNQTLGHIDKYVDDIKSFKK